MMAIDGRNFIANAFLSRFCNKAFDALVEANSLVDQLEAQAEAFVQKSDNDARRQE
jgi:hypothetical protein